MMYRIQKIVPNFSKIWQIVLLAIIVSALPAIADVSGRYGNEFMAAGGGARALALGGAYSSLSNDVWSLYWNPSGLVKTDRHQAGFMHSERFDGVVDYDVLAASIPKPDGSVMGAGIIRLGVNGVPFTKTENGGNPSESNRIVVDKIVNEAEYAFFLAHADRWKNWNWGVAPKLIFKHFGSEHQAYGLGVDAGIGTRPVNSLPVDVGFAVRDMLSTLLLWDTGRKEIIAPTTRLGISGIFELPALEATLIPVVDIEYQFQNFGDSDAAIYHAGFEYSIRHTANLRIGSNNGALTFGGGIQLKPMSLDYAFIGHDELGETHRISLTVRWGSVQNK